jgi:hypothetical protein
MNEENIINEKLEDKGEDKIEENENINPSVEIAEENDETEKKNPSKLSSFFNNFAASLIDGVVISAVSVILLYALDFILRLAAGLYITDRMSMLLIIFIVVVIFYPCIMYSTKGNTFGRSYIKEK